MGDSGQWILLTARTRPRVFLHLILLFVTLEVSGIPEIKGRINYSYRAETRDANPSFLANFLTSISFPPLFSTRNVF